MKNYIVRAEFNRLNTRAWVIVSGESIPTLSYAELPVELRPIGAGIYYQVTIPYKEQLGDNLVALFSYPGEEVYLAL